MWNAFKKLLFIIIYVLDRYKTKQMCHKIILENGRMLEFILDCYKSQKMCNKALDNYSYPLKSVLNCWKK